MKHVKLRPNHVRVMGRNYVVAYEHEALLGSVALGICDNQNMIIGVREGQHPVEEADTLLHEIFHAIWYCMSVSLGGADEETVVRRMSSGMLQVIMDNRHLLKYFAAVENLDR